LIDDLTRESIHLRGLDLIYIPRRESAPGEGDGVDYLFGEDPENDFRDGVTLEMWPEQMQGFEGEGDFMAGFGLDIRDECTFIISKTRFGETVTRANAHITRPREGDLISFEMTKAVFEITFVEHELPFYQMGKGHVYKLSCKRFEYSHEDITDAGDVAEGIPDFPDVDDSADVQTESDTFVNFDEQDPFSEDNY
jgi:hypothetical protein